MSSMGVVVMQLLRLETISNITVTKPTKKHINDIINQKIEAGRNINIYIILQVTYVPHFASQARALPPTPSVPKENRVYLQ